jgi:multiple sugar transport system substrate-binding protein
VEHNRLTTRRSFLKGAAAAAATATIGALLAACGGSSATDTPKAAAGGAASSTTAPASGTTAPASGTSAASGGTTAATTTGSSPVSAPAKSFGGKLTAWGIVSFTKDGDNLLGQQMQDWGKANNVSVEYVALPGSDYTTKVAAAVETGAIPDVVMMSGTSTIFYAAQNRLVDLTDVYNNLKGLGGGMFEQLLPFVQTGGKVYSIPMESDVSVMYARLDLCEKATGKRQPPATIDELDMIARKINAPPTQYGIGLTLGRTPDGAGNITTLIFGDGGTLVDKDGKPAINNDGTVSALTRVQTWWKDKIIPQDAPGWDDSGNNNSYQSKQSAFVFNPASIFAFLDQNDKELLGNTIQAPTPKGKAGISYNGVGTWSWSVFSASKQVEAGKAMIQAIMQPDKMEAVY